MRREREEGRDKLRRKMSEGVDNKVDITENNFIERVSALER